MAGGSGRVEQRKTFFFHEQFKKQKQESGYLWILICIDQPNKILLFCTPARIQN